MTVDQDSIARYGIPARSVLDVIEAMGVRKTGEIREGQRRFDLGVRLSEEYRDAKAVGSVLVAGPAGERIPLARLTTIKEISGPTTIQHEWGKRRIVVQANVRGADLGKFVELAHLAIDAKVQLPEGNFVHFGGQFENLERARTRLAIVVPLALALVFFLLYLSNRQVWDSVRIFSGAPFALVARYQREEGANAILGTLSLDLPVFNRNQAGRGVVVAQTIQAERALEATERRVRQEVLLAYGRFDAALEAARAFEGEVVGAAQENLALLGTACQAGKIGLFEFLLIRRDAIESQRGYFEALEEVVVAEAEFGRAIGAEGGRP